MNQKLFEELDNEIEAIDIRLNLTIQDFSEDLEALILNTINSIDKKMPDVRLKTIRNYNKKIDEMFKQQQDFLFTYKTHLRNNLLHLENKIWLDVVNKKEKLGSYNEE